MSIVIPEGFASAAWIINGQYGTGPFVTTMGLGVASADGEYQLIANRCFNAFADNFLPRMSNGLTLSKVVLTVNEGGDLGSVDSSLTPATGGRSQGDDVIALALLLNKQTSILGRAGRGRMFIPGVLGDEDTGLGGEYTSSARNDFQERADDFLDYLTGQQPGQDHPTLPVLLHSDDRTPTPISRLILNRKVGVLRKRLR